MGVVRDRQLLSANYVRAQPHTTLQIERSRWALPVVLSADEVVRFLEAIPSLKSRTALTTVYVAGLRVSEVVLLTASGL